MIALDFMTGYQEPNDSDLVSNADSLFFDIVATDKNPVSDGVESSGSMMSFQYIWKPDVPLGSTRFVESEGFQFDFNAVGYDDDGDYVEWDQPQTKPQAETEPPVMKTLFADQVLHDAGVATAKDRIPVAMVPGRGGHRSVSEEAQDFAYEFCQTIPGGVVVSLHLNGLTVAADDDGVNLFLLLDHNQFEAWKRWIADLGGTPEPLSEERIASYLPRYREQCLVGAWGMSDRWYA